MQTLKDLHQKAKKLKKPEKNADAWQQGHAAAWTEVDKTLTYLTSPRRIKQKYGASLKRCFK